MEVKYSVRPKDFKRYTNEEINDQFLVQQIFVTNEIKMVYSFEDRVIIGGIMPIDAIEVKAPDKMRARFFLENREMGIVNIGGKGKISVDERRYVLEEKDGIYIGKGSEKILAMSVNKKYPAKFYFMSTPAHTSHKIEIICFGSVNGSVLGSINESNRRKIYKYIHPEGVKSCQLVMGITELEPGSVWNSMPCHTHDRRSEVYFYYGLSEDSVVFHLMGQPSEIKNIIVRNEQAVISPSWSVHFGAGTQNYNFIWGMAGENQIFEDMDFVYMRKLNSILEVIT